MSQNRIFDTLESLGVATLETREVLAEGTRDNEHLPVYRDRLSGVIYIDDHYVGDTVYREGQYRQETIQRSGHRDFELGADTRRRAIAYAQYYVGNTVTEFGCGEGAFLRSISGQAAQVSGIELQSDYVTALTEDGYRCFENAERIKQSSQDVVFAFHVVEHLPDPLAALSDLRRLLKNDGYIVVEVPHASDFLLSHLKSDAFTKFTVWSQHLILHTRESLKRLLLNCGYTDIVVEGIQRYPLSNHLGWLAMQAPGGHKTPLSVLDTPELKSAYQAALQKIDATDTLVAIAKKA
ncbi:class I SAM-dependent methyltransferase [Roseibium salinum]